MSAGDAISYLAYLYMSKEYECVKHRTTSQTWTSCLGLDLNILFPSGISCHYIETFVLTTEIVI